MTDRLIAAIVAAILSGAFLWQGQHWAAAVVAGLGLLYLWKGPK